MDMKKSCRSFPVLGWLLTLFFLSLLTSNGHAANYALEIIQPQPNLNTLNRFYKAYPGLEYNVRLAVIGGEFPYRYVLTTGPAGMTIDRRGEITWANPTKASTPYSVSVTVTDAESISRSVSWNIAVTTDGFYFIDAINGTPDSQGGTGSLNNPWRSMKDMYEGDVIASKNANSYAGGFVYWRNGTYTMDAYKENVDKRTPFAGNKKPQVWLAYPGESPVMDMLDAYLAFYGPSNNTYIDGLEFNVRNSRGFGVNIGSSSNNVTFRRNKLYGITNGYTGGNNSLIFITKNSAGNYYSIQDNEMYNVNKGYGVLGYSARNVLVEDNKLHHIHAHAIGPKEGTAMWFIRGNHMYDNHQNSIGLQYSNSSGILSGDIEISYNIVESGGGKVRINSNHTSSGLPVYIYRNTFLDDVEVAKVTSNNGPFYFYDNVIVNESSYPEKIQQTYSIDDQSHLIVTNNLTGDSSDNIVDTKGNLTTDYFAYVGKRGYQIGNPPLPPIGFSVQ